MRDRFSPTIDVYGPVATHDMPCAVCYHPPEPAVYDLNNGTFQPSHRAQFDGWILVKCEKRWMRRLLYHLGLIGYFDITPLPPQESNER